MIFPLPQRILAPQMILFSVYCHGAKIRKYSVPTGVEVLLYTEQARCELINAIELLDVAAS